MLHFQKCPSPLLHSGDNFRQTKTVNGETTSFILDGMDVAIESGSQNTITYLRGMGLEGYLKNGTSRKYYYNEPNGSTYIIYGDENNNYEPVGEYAYGGFGNLIWDNWQETSFAYAGEYHDDETGFIYLRNRYYDPETGRFISEDPAMDGLNWYAYCNNNPVNFVDPWGLDARGEGTKYERFVTYLEMQALTDDILSFSPETGDIYIHSKHEGELSKPAGTELVRRIIENENFMLTIQRNGISDSGNKLGTQIVSYNSKATTINISDDYNANSSAYLLVSNGIGTSRLESFADTPSYIFLGHEMIHALHYMEGTFNSSKGEWRFYIDHNNKIAKEFINRSQNADEFDTVGLAYLSYTLNPNYQNKGRPPYFTPNDYMTITENALRREHGLSIRRAYKIY